MCARGDVDGWASDQRTELVERQCGRAHAADIELALGVVERHGAADATGLQRAVAVSR